MPSSALPPGYIFLSSSATCAECLQRELFGSPAGQLKKMERITDETLLFLLDFETQTMHGVFRAAGRAAINIVPEAWKTTCRSRTFPAQIKVKQLGGS